MVQRRLRLSYFFERNGAGEQKITRVPALLIQTVCASQKNRFVPKRLVRVHAYCAAGRWTLPCIIAILKLAEFDSISTSNRCSIKPLQLMSVEMTSRSLRANHCVARHGFPAIGKLKTTVSPSYCDE